MFFEETNFGYLVLANFCIFNEKLIPKSGYFC